MNKQELDNELIDRELASRKLDCFTTYTFPWYEMIAEQNWEKIHEKIIHKLEAVERWEIKRLMIFCPPRMWKSELVSKRFPAWCLWRNPNRNIIVSSYWADLASDFWRKTKQIVEQQEFKNIFPDFELSKDKKESWNRETKEQGWMYTVWVGWALTWKGWDILIIDDPVKDRQEAESPTIQQRNIDWYTSTFRTRKQSENSSIIVMMTRRNVNDLAWYLLAEEKNWWERFEILIVQWIDNNANEIIWEWKWGKWYMQNEKANISPKDWAALYQQDPIASSSNIFSLADIRYFLMSDFEKEDWILKKEDLRCIISVDPAFSSSDSSDDASALLLWKHKISGNYYQLDWYADTSAPSYTFKAILSMYDRAIMDWYDVEFISIESVKLNKDQTKFIEDFRTFLKEKDRYIIVSEHKPGWKKVDRIKFTLEPKVSTHAIYLRKDMADKSFTRRMEDQFYQFPNCKKFDIIDNLEHWVDVLDNKWGKTLEKKERVYHNKMNGRMMNTWQQNRGQRFWL